MNAITNHASVLARSLLLAALVGMPALGRAAAIPEKGAERLTKLTSLKTVADVQRVEPGDTLVMSCPKCRDTWVKAVQPMGRAGKQETATIPRHECPGCQTKWTTEGTGKQAKTVFKHVCRQCGSEDAYCCVLKKGDGPTPGMEAAPAQKHGTGAR